jgi:tryptophan 2,3-dioxygenase
MELDDGGRRTDGKHLSYDDYINVPALLGSLRVPKDVPRGIVAASWPEWPAGWKPGDAWPRGGNWEHDEALFITTHQAFEVWFRQMRLELDDLLQRARERAERHGARIPQVHLSTRRIEKAPPLARRLSHFPRLAALADASELKDVLLHQMPTPGTFPDDDEEQVPCRLAWFDDQWALWTDRVDRAAQMLRVCIPFYDVLGHMTPRSFLAFRERLAPASGFGSTQFRRIELMLGLRERHFGKFTPGTAPRDALAARFRREEIDVPHREEESFARHSPGAETGLADEMLATSLRDLVYWLLRAEEFLGSGSANGGNGAQRWQLADRVAAANFAAIERDRAVQDKNVSAVVTGEVVRELGKLLVQMETVTATASLEQAGAPSGFTRFLNACLLLDNTVLDWRDVHIRFVERMIGARPGTGGGGLKYLRRALAPTNEPYILRAFPCLWDARTTLTRST